jgi:hypothetical protein
MYLKTHTLNFRSKIPTIRYTSFDRQKNIAEYENIKMIQTANE